MFLQLLKSKEKFDLILIESFFNEFVLPLIGFHKVPFIYLSSFGPEPWFLDAIDSPLAYNHFPNFRFRFEDEMNLFQRTIHGMSIFIVMLVRNGFVIPTIDRIATEILGNPINLTLSSKMVEEEYLSFLISRSTPGINYGLPKSDRLVEAGALHCVPSKPLPNDLEVILDDSGEDGIIFVSFGTLLKGSNMPVDVKQTFLSTFSRLRQKVILKWDENDKQWGLENKIPPNVKLISWLPQQDLLGHPKTRLFITHAGLSSIEEAVYHGIPVIALPVFGDQHLNADKIKMHGYGIRLDWGELSEDSLYDAIQEILKNPKYV